MARNPKTKQKRSDRRRPGRTDGGGKQRRGRPKVCLFCKEHATWVDYKDTRLLQRFVSERGRIKARGVTGTCAQHQRDVAVAIKTARELALMPYSVRTASTDGPGGRGRGRQPRGDAQRPAEAESAENGETGAAPSGDNGAGADTAAEEVQEAPAASG